LLLYICVPLTDQKTFYSGKIVREHCIIYWQLKCQISVKSAETITTAVFVKSPQNRSGLYKWRQTWNCSVLGWPLWLLFALTD